jgi:stage III sporulation protein AE
MICVLTAVTVITPPLLTVYERSLSAITRTGGFISVFVPIFAAVTAAAGGLTSGSAYDILILAVSEVVVQLSVRLLMPVLSITTVLAISGSVFPNASLDSISVLLKKLVTWGLTVAMTLFTGFVSMKCTLTGKADGAATKTAKFMISGFVPVVGSAVSDAYATVRSSLDVMRTTIGAAGTVAVVLIMLPPILEIMAFRAAMWAGAAAADVFSVAPLSKLLKGLDSGLAVAQSVLVCYSVIFVICTGILMNAVN